MPATERGGIFKGLASSGALVYSEGCLMLAASSTRSSCCKFWIFIQSSYYCASLRPPSHFDTLVIEVELETVLQQDDCSS